MSEEKKFNLTTAQAYETAGTKYILTEEDKANSKFGKLVFE